MKFLDLNGVSILWRRIKETFARKDETIKNISRNDTTFTVTRADGTTFEFTQKDTTYDVATTASSGLMSAVDKAKLNGVESGAQPNVIESVSVNGTEQQVTAKGVDITVPTALSDLTDDVGYLTEESDPTVPAWAKQPQKPAYTASEVGALPADTHIPTDVSELNNDVGYLTEHQDISNIENAITELTTKLNALADSDDTTLDQLSEIVAYIKNNKSLIDGITTGKVSVDDIVDNLTSAVANKPLSAKQGKALKDMIDAIVVPTNVSDLNNDLEFTTKQYVDSKVGGAHSFAIYLNWNSTYSGGTWDLINGMTLDEIVSAVANNEPVYAITQYERYLLIHANYTAGSKTIGTMEFADDASIYTLSFSGNEGGQFWINAIGYTDWNASPGEPGYIGNRTHYIDYDSFTLLDVSDVHPTAIEPISIGSVPYSPAIGSTVVLTVNGDTYECEVTELTGGGVQFSGNYGAYTVLIDDANNARFITTTSGGSYTIQVAMEEYEVHKLNNMYLNLDTTLDASSDNPVANSAVAGALNAKVDASDLATVATSGSYTDLANKPSIPTVPTKVSAFTNDADYVNEQYVDNAITAALADVVGIEYHVCTTAEYDAQTYIPTLAGEAGVIYLVPKSASLIGSAVVGTDAVSGNNIYYEFIYNGRSFEMIGDTQVSLDGYLEDSDISTDAQVQSVITEVFGGA